MILDLMRTARLGCGLLGSVWLLSGCGRDERVPPDVDDHGGSFLSGAEQDADDGDSGSADGPSSAGRASGGRSSGGHEGGSAGSEPSGGGADAGSEGRVCVEVQTDLGDVRFDMPIQEEGLDLFNELMIDLDGDGHRDALSWLGSQVGIGLADGLGGYTWVHWLWLGGAGGPEFVGPEAGDFNADGLPDLIGEHSVFLGLGDGTFTEQYLQTSGLTGDFNGDGRDDFFTSEEHSSSVRLTNEDLTARVVELPFSGSNEDSALGDFDGDGHVDVVQGAQVRRGNGDGTFGAPLASDCPCSDVVKGARAVADFNADGRDDLLLASLNALYVLLGQADGSLALEAQSEFAWPLNLDATDLRRMSVADDLDDDGHLDWVAHLGDALDVFYGDGAGKFVDHKRYFIDTHTYPRPPIIEDRDGDGLKDVLLGGRWIALGRDDRRLRAPELSYFSGEDRPIVARLSEDGPLQLVELSTDGGIRRWPLGSERTLQARETCPSIGAGTDRMILDMTGDGLADIVSFNGQLDLWLGQGGCSFQAVEPPALEGVGVGFVRLNDDELLDVVYRASSGLGVALATGPGTLAAPVISPLSGDERSITAADFNGDGRGDIAIQGWNYLEILLSDENYHLSQVGMFDWDWDDPAELKSADIDNDGDVDILATRSHYVYDYGHDGSIDEDPLDYDDSDWYYRSKLHLLRNDGDAGFTSESLFYFDGKDLVIADVDSDGLEEVVTASNEEGMTQFYRVDESCSATLLDEVPMPRSVLRDADGDGDLDLVVVRDGWVAVGNNLTVE